MSDGLLKSPRKLNGTCQVEDGVSIWAAGHRNELSANEGLMSRWRFPNRCGRRLPRNLASVH